MDPFKTDPRWVKINRAYEARDAARKAIKQRPDWSGTGEYAAIIGLATLASIGAIATGVFVTEKTMSYFAEDEQWIDTTYGYGIPPGYYGNGSSYGANITFVCDQNGNCLVDDGATTATTDTPDPNACVEIAPGQYDCPDQPLPCTAPVPPDA